MVCGRISFPSVIESVLAFLCVHTVNGRLADPALKPGVLQLAQQTRLTPGFKSLVWHISWYTCSLLCSAASVIS